MLVCKCGLVQILFEMLEKATNDKEQLSTCRMLWSLSFVNEGREAIKTLPVLVSMLIDLEESKNSALKKAAEGILWELNKHDYCFI